MAKLKDGIITEWNGVVDAEMKDGVFVAYVKTDKQVREMVLELVKALEVKIEVEKAILVGRYAKGCPDEWDGIEVGIVSPDFAGMSGVDRVELTSKLATSDKVHHLVGVCGEFTPEKFRNGQIESLYGWNWRNGKVIYERDR